MTLSVSGKELKYERNQPNLIIPELDSDPAILKIIHDGERLQMEACRKDLMQILKIQPLPASDSSFTLNNSVSHESLPTTPGSTTENHQTSPKRATPSSYRRHRNHAKHNQRSLNSTGNSSTNRSLLDSPKSTSNNSFMKQSQSDRNLSSSSPISKSKANSMPMKTNVFLTSSSSVLVTDYRHSSTMKRIVNPQWNVIPFA